MIHVAASKRPEIVLFGRDQRLKTPLVLEAGNHILVTSTDSGEIAVSRFAVGEADQRRLVSDRIDEVIRAIVDLGATYPDVVQALQQAETSRALASRFEIDAVPEAGRTYRRVADTPEERDSEDGGFLASSPLPSLFPKKGGRSSRQEDSQLDNRQEDEAKESDESEENPRPLASFFARMMGLESK
jgi:hypothetical protein